MKMAVTMAVCEQKCCKQSMSAKIHFTVNTAVGTVTELFYKEDTVSEVSFLKMRIEQINKCRN